MTATATIHIPARTHSPQFLVLRVCEDGSGAETPTITGDSGITIGGTAWLGREVARQASDLVLLDDDFATLVEALVEGRSFWRNMRSGLGLRMLFDRDDAHFGFNFTYSADICPVRPLIASLVFDAGTVGDAWLLHGRGAIGVTYHGWEAFGGYDWLRIGNVDLSWT